MKGIQIEIELRTNNRARIDVQPHDLRRASLYGERKADPTVAAAKLNDSAVDELGRLIASQPFKEGKRPFFRSKSAR